MTDHEHSDTGQRLGLRQVLGSVLAAFIGVQSNRNRLRDFRHGNPVHYIVAGAVMTLVFVLLIWTVVQLVLSTVGAG